MSAKNVKQLGDSAQRLNDIANTLKEAQDELKASFKTFSELRGNLDGEVDYLSGAFDVSLEQHLGEYVSLVLLIGEQMTGASNAMLGQVGSAVKDAMSQISATNVEYVQQSTQDTETHVTRLNATMGELTESVNTIINELRNKFESYATVENEKLKNAQTAFEGSYDKFKSEQFGPATQKASGVADEIKKVLVLRQDHLFQALESLKAEFQDELTQQIETVFDGVQKMKQELKEVSNDTVNRIRSNFSRLEDQVDKYLVARIGDTQTLIQKYEDKFQSALEETKTLYTEESDRVIEDFSNLTGETVANIVKELDGTLSSHSETVENMTSATLDELHAISINFGKLLDDVKGTLQQRIGADTSQVESECAEFIKLITDSTERVSTFADNRFAQATEESKVLLDGIVSENNQKMDQIKDKLQATLEGSKAEEIEKFRTAHRETNERLDERAQVATKALDRARGKFDKAFDELVKIRSSLKEA